jgi:hypothetical protein
MNTFSRSPKLSPPVIRHFEFTRLQDQLIARAYQVLIPVVSRPLVRPRPGCSPPTTIQSFPSKAQGA